MQYFESLVAQASELTIYDVKSAVTKAKNLVLNYTEYEAKVREATNDDTWGASSTLMQDIAQATFNFQLFNEIMPTIYQRFTEKEARQWRQIYKALVLLEYLVKNGSERVIDDARQHLSMIKLLRNFHYIDEAGKDQGINVRNRSKELAELLSDLDRVRQERRKAKANRNKYTGVANDGSSGPSFTSATGSRYGGFGSDAFDRGGGGGGGGGGYSGSGGGGGGSSYQDSSRDNNDDYDYDAGEWDDRAGGSSSTTRNDRSSSSRTAAPSNGHRAATSSRATQEPVKPTPPTPEINLFDMDDEPVAAPAPPAKSTPFAAAAADDDDFDDFQTASFAPAPAAQPAAAPAARPAGGADVFALLNSKPAAAPAFGRPASTPIAAPALQPASSFSARPPAATASSFSSPPAAAKPAADFSDLFSIGPMSSSSKPATPSGGAATGKLSMAELAAKNRQASLFGSGGQQQTQQQGGGGWDSLI